MGSWRWPQAQENDFNGGGGGAVHYGELCEGAGGCGRGVGVGVCGEGSAVRAGLVVGEMLFRNVSCVVAEPTRCGSCRCLGWAQRGG